MCGKIAVAQSLSVSFVKSFIRSSIGIQFDECNGDRHSATNVAVHCTTGDANMYDTNTCYNQKL